MSKQLTYYDYNTRVNDNGDTELELTLHDENEDDVVVTIEKEKLDELLDYVKYVLLR